MSYLTKTIIKESKMILRTFMKWLSKSHETMKWKDDGNGWIRATIKRNKCKQGEIKDEFCPITAVYYLKYGTILQDFSYPTAAVKMKLDKKLADEIAAIADGLDRQSIITKAKLAKVLHLPYKKYLTKK